MPRRELAIVAAGVLELAIAELLSLRLAGDSKEIEDFLGLNEDGRAPCGTFGDAALPKRIGMSAGNNAFAFVSGDEAATTVSPTRMQTDLAELLRVSKRVNHRVNKVHAHIERDKRRIGSAIGLAEIDAALKVLLEIHHRYALMIQGRDVKNIMTAEDFDIRCDLDKIWPPRS